MVVFTKELATGQYLLTFHDPKCEGVSIVVSVAEWCEDLVAVSPDERS